MTVSELIVDLSHFSRIKDLTIPCATSTIVGSLSFVSIPTGAEIYLALNGQALTDRGMTTPSIISDLPIGLYDYMLRLTGYNDYSSSVMVVQGIITNIPIAMLIPAEGCVSFNSNSQGARIILDGIDTGQITPSLICNITLGYHTYQFTLPGYSISGDFTLISGEGLTISRDLLPAEGCIFFDTVPQGAYIYLDGNTIPIGQTPYLKCDLSLGLHTYSLVLEGYSTVTNTVEIIVGQGINVITTLVTCTPNWQCEPGNTGYESDGCNNRRSNSICNPPVEAGFGSGGLILLGGLLIGALLMSHKTTTQERRITSRKK